MGYNTTNNREFYKSLVRAEFAKIKPQATGITRHQIAAAKGRATKAFKIAEKEYWSAK